MPSSADPADCFSAIRPAPLQAWFVGGLALLAVLAIALSGLPILVSVVSGLLTMAYAAMVIRRCFRPRFKRFGLSRHAVILSDRRGAELRCRLRRPAFLSPAFIGLPLVDGNGRRFACGFFSSQLDGDVWRQALVRLKGQTLD
jgi:hypothetical protein